MVDEKAPRKDGAKELPRRLKELGIYETPEGLNRKINSRRFAAALFLACCHVLEIWALNLSIVS
ncbi:DUF6471 domain-containing protein [Herminiimonas fonticola]|uniref:DUF6471 domain-containing protein n=1 Tax=Herminiimonas fonticola TaxID=303380 RepID=UPI003BAA389F